MELKGQHTDWTINDSLEELAQLAITVQLEVVGDTYQRLERVDPATYIGKGKLEEIAAYHNESQFDVLVFDDELSPRQQRNLEEALGARALDRTALILDIFAQHAHTREGAMQVELAQYEYLLPRLTGQWGHLGRQVGGARGGSRGAGGGGPGVGLRGPGETQLETDRREIRRRIAHLKSNLEDVRRQRTLHREQRRKRGIPTVALVGYTNAGKSTLLNALTDSDVYVANQLFATLDPTTRRVALPSGRHALLTDTVGFIKKLPTTLVAAFRATLEEVIEADALLHVLDVTHPHVREQNRAVLTTLEELGAADKRIVVALNKTDNLQDHRVLRDLALEFPGAVAISAMSKTGLEELLGQLEQVLLEDTVPVKVKLPHRAAELLAIFHDQGTIEWEEHSEEGTNVKGCLPERLLDLFQDYFVADFKPTRGVKQRVRSASSELLE